MRTTASSLRSPVRSVVATRSSPWRSVRSASSRVGGRACIWRPDRRAASRWRDRAVAAPMIAAVIDIGSNSVLLLTVALDADGRARGIDQALATTRLAAGLRRGGTLDAAARARTREAVSSFVDSARAAGARRTWAFATGAMRDAGDGRDFAAELHAATGVPVEGPSG